MPRAVERFLAAAGDVEVREFPEGTRTAADAAAAIGVEAGQIVKSLLWMAGDEPVLALVAGDRRLDPDGLRAALGVEAVRSANADEAREATGFSIGGVPPFGHPAPIRTIMDESLNRFDELWAAAGTPRDVFRATPHELAERARARIEAITE
jgi:prolyl-tRNA editing enzyme YbaK/EbsC (Cys-tRNA(Pro) deacylase)